MNDQDLDRLVALAAPVTDAEIAEWLANSAQDELFDRIVTSMPEDGQNDAANLVAPHVRSSRRWRRIAPLAAAAATIAAVVAVGGLSDGDNGERAWAAPLVEFAQRSPLLVLDDPQWLVTRADEKGDVGEMSFSNGFNTADLHWQPAASGVDLNDRFSTGVDRGYFPTPTGNADVVEIPVIQVDPATELTTPPTVADGISQDGEVMPGADPSVVTALPVRPDNVDGTGAVLPGATPVVTVPLISANGSAILPIRFAATWPVDGRLVQLDSTVDTLVEFTNLLAALEPVDVDTWLSAMPASVIQAANQPDLIAELLADVPVPDGFDPASIDIDADFSDRYQLVTKVAGAVTCSWLDVWFTGGETGDVAAQQAAADALATSRTWAMLLSIQSEGAYADQVWQYADAINGGPGILTGGGPVPPTREIAAGGLGCGQ